MSKEFQIRDGNLIASFDLENEDGDIDFCKLLKVSHGVADEIGMFVDYVATNKIIKDQSKQIIDLEAKLAECEKQCQQCKHLNKKIELNIKNKLMAENCELQKQLADKEQENERLKEEFCKYEITLMDKNAQLKQQLHDLPKKIVEEIRDCLLDFSNGWWRYFMTDGCEYMLSSDLQGCLDEIIDIILKSMEGKMKANDLFNDLGFKKNIHSNTFLVYLFETDYDKLYVDFDLVLKRYYLISERFIDRNDIDFIPMEERPQNIKHSASYGHWQSDNCIFIDMKLHNAIHQQLLELGWIKGDVEK